MLHQLDKSTGERLAVALYRFPIETQAFLGSTYTGYLARIAVVPSLVHLRTPCAPVH
jgi:hypothetical protein